jgi:hypothetical protein
MNYLNLMDRLLENAIAAEEITTSSVEFMSRVLNGYFHNARLLLMEDMHDGDIQKKQMEIFDLIWKGIR